MKYIILFIVSMNCWAFETGDIVHIKGDNTLMIINGDPVGSKCQVIEFRRYRPILIECSLLERE